MSENNTVLCCKCKIRIDIEKAIRSSSKSHFYYCKDCWDRKQNDGMLSEERAVLIEVVRDVFNCSMSAKLWSEAKRLRDKYGFSPKDIAMCIDYLYRVKQKNYELPNFFSVDDASMRAARAYFKKEQEAQQSQQESIKHYSFQEPETVYVKFQPPNQTQFIDLATLLRGDTEKWY